MTGVLIDWGGTGSVVAARTRLDTDGARIVPPASTGHRVLGPTVIDLDPTDPGEAWRIRCYPTDRTAWTWWVLVPDAPAGQDPIPLADLTRVDPTTLQPDTGPDPAAWTAQLAQERTARTAALTELAQRFEQALAGLPVAGPSHIAVDDVDGVPAYVLGAAEASLSTDVDGVPVVVPTA